MGLAVWITTAAVIMPMSPWVQAAGPLRACHRGIMSVAPENTEPAIAAAVGKAEIVDVDLIVTQYGDIVCAHDEKLNELDPKLGATSIRSLTREQIKKINIGQDIPYDRDGGPAVQHYAKVTKFAFLDEVFDKYIDELIFWLDIKNRTYISNSRQQDVAVLDRFLQSKKKVLDRVIISSTNPFIVIDLAKLAKQHGYFQHLTIGLDYGGSNDFTRLAMEWGNQENKNGFNFMAVGRDNLLDRKGLPAKGQAIIDKRLKKNPDFKVLVYNYKPGETPEFKHLYSYMIEYLQQYPVP